MKKSISIKQFIKFILVGILNTIFGYGLWAILIFAGMHYALAVILSTIIAVLFNFKTTGCIVFKNKDNKLLWKFIQMYIVTTFLSILVLKCAKMLNINLYLAGFFLTGIIAMISFIIQKYYVFRKIDNEEN